MVAPNCVVICFALAIVFSCFLNKCLTFFYLIANRRVMMIVPGDLSHAKHQIQTGYVSPVVGNWSFNSIVISIQQILLGDDQPFTKSAPFTIT